VLPKGDDDLQGDEFPAFPVELGQEPVFTLAQFPNSGRVNECRRLCGCRAIVVKLCECVIKVLPAKSMVIFANCGVSIHSVKQATPPMKS
jgi:hypothetical protein